MRAERDAKTVFYISKSFFDALSQGTTHAEKDVKIGKEAVSDNLSSSLSASKGFYDALWKQMEHVFEPTCRYVGEQYALGKIGRNIR